MMKNSKKILFLLCLSFCFLAAQTKNIIYFENKAGRDLAIEVYQNDNFLNYMKLPQSLDLDQFKKPISTLTLEIRPTSILSGNVKNAFIKAPKPGKTYSISNKLVGQDWVLIAQ